MAGIVAPVGLRDAIQRIADAVASGGRQELNDALSNFSMLAEPILIPFVESQLRRRKVGGPDGTITEAGVVLNEVLFKLLNIAWRCTASDDQRALAWLLTVTKNVVKDETKRSIDRLRNLIERLLDLGYFHPSWVRDGPTMDQEESNDEQRNDDEPPNNDL